VWKTLFLTHQLSALITNSINKSILSIFNYSVNKSTLSMCQRLCLCVTIAATTTDFTVINVWANLVPREFTRRQWCFHNIWPVACTCSIQRKHIVTVYSFEGIAKALFVEWPSYDWDSFWLASQSPPYLYIRANPCCAAYIFRWTDNNLLYWNFL